MSTSMRVIGLYLMRLGDCWCFFLVWDAHRCHLATK